MDSLERALSRRELLRGGALLAGAAGLAAAGFPLPPPVSRADSYLRRCVTLGANGVINPGSSQDYEQNRAFLLETGTKWVRMWADWPSLQPESSAAPDRGSAAWKVRELDRQIAQANADGIEVILTSYRFPRWANGSAALTPAQDAAYQLHDRISKGADPARRRDLRFKLPSDLSTSGAWGRWIHFLAARYSRRSPSRKAVVAFLEVCNEPNLQVWPQQGRSLTADLFAPGPPTVHLATARMFRSAKAIVAAYGNEPLLCGPGTSDRTGESRLGTGYDTFTDRLLTELERIGFNGGRTFAWTHHNFTDVELDEGVRAARVRRLLANRWIGWPAADRSAPAVLIPEGGARLPRVGGVARQAELVQRNWERMAGPEGAGIAMVAQYLFHTDPNYDSGLVDVDGGRRPAYAAWGALR